MVKEIVMQVQEAQRGPNKMDAKRPTPSYVIIKVPRVKDREKILKAEREKKIITYRGIPIRLSADFSEETLCARRDWQEISKSGKVGTYIQDYSTQHSHSPTRKN